MNNLKCCFLKKIGEKSQKTVEKHDLQETDEFSKKRQNISQALFNFRCLQPITPALVRRVALRHVNLSYSDSHEIFLLAPGDEAGTRSNSSYFEINSKICKYVPHNPTFIDV